MSKLRIEEPDRLDTGTTAARAAVQTFGALDLGAPFAVDGDAADRAVGALAATPTTALFPALVPASADTIALFTFAEGGMSRIGFGVQLADLHRIAIDAAPQFANFLRSGLVVARVRAMAAAAAPADRDAVVAAEAEAVASYVRTVAAQLAGRPEYEPHASTLAVEVPELRARIDATRARHQAHVNEVLLQQQAEQQAADAVIADAERQRREKVAEYLMTRHGLGFLIRGERFSGGALAQAARRIGVRDDSGSFVTFTIEELETARDRQMAADAAVAGGVQ